MPASCFIINYRIWTFKTKEMDLNKIISSCDILADQQLIQHAQQSSSFLAVNVILIILTLTVLEKKWCHAGQAKQF